MFTGSRRFGDKVNNKHFRTNEEIIEEIRQRQEWDESSKDNDVAASTTWYR